MSATQLSAHSCKFEPNGVIGSLASVKMEAMQLLMEFDALSQQLDIIFLHAPIGENPNMDHQTLHRFRGRASRRIARCSAILRTLNGMLEEIPMCDLRSELLYSFDEAQYSLSRSKCILSNWWKKNERRFHQLRIAAALNDMDRDSNHFIEETSHLLALEKLRMQDTHQQLDQSSQLLDSSQKNLIAHQYALSGTQATLSEIQHLSGFHSQSNKK